MPKNQKKLNKIRFFYLNDEQSPVNVFHKGGLSGEPYQLAPGQGAYFDVELKDEQLIFIKKWPGYENRLPYLMISKMDKFVEELGDVKKVEDIRF